jgi:hypothetical protein
MSTATLDVVETLDRLSPRRREEEEKSFVVPRVMGIEASGGRPESRTFGSEPGRCGTVPVEAGIVST